MTDGPRDDAGVLRFARYAIPPNLLGYCGPADHAALLEHVDAGAVDGDLVALARGFAGAWPYLELIAACNPPSRPLDQAVIEAYWLGNRLLDRVPGGVLARTLDDRFRRRLPGSTDPLVDPVRRGAVAHHSLHVLAVYPWIGLLRAGQRDPSLGVMEHCLIRWGRVRAREAGSALVDVVTLAWDGRDLSLGPIRPAWFTCAADGRRLVDVAPGDLVAVHWDWVCDVLTPGETLALADTTRRNLAAVHTAEDPVRQGSPDRVPVPRITR